MDQNVLELVEIEKREGLEEFAGYLGIDYEDYLEYLHPNIDFDDYSR